MNFEEPDRPAGRRVYDDERIRNRILDHLNFAKSRLGKIARTSKPLAVWTAKKMFEMNESLDVYLSHSSDTWWDTTVREAILRIVETSKKEEYRDMFTSQERSEELFSRCPNLKSAEYEVKLPDGTVGKGGLLMNREQSYCRRTIQQPIDLYIEDDIDGRPTFPSTDQWTGWENETAKHIVLTSRAESTVSNVEHGNRYLDWIISDVPRDSSIKSMKIQAIPFDLPLLKRLVGTSIDYPCICQYSICCMEPITLQDLESFAQSLKQKWLTINLYHQTVDGHSRNPLMSLKDLPTIVQMVNDKFTKLHRLSLVFSGMGEIGPIKEHEIALLGVPPKVAPDGIKGITMLNIVISEPYFLTHQSSLPILAIARNLACLKIPQKDGWGACSVIKCLDEIEQEQYLPETTAEVSEIVQFIVKHSPAVQRELLTMNLASVGANTKEAFLQLRFRPNGALIPIRIQEHLKKLETIKSSWAESKRLVNEGRSIWDNMDIPKIHDLKTYLLEVDEPFEEIYWPFEDGRTKFELDRAKRRKRVLDDGLEDTQADSDDQAYKNYCAESWVESLTKEVDELKERRADLAIRLAALEREKGAPRGAAIAGAESSEGV